MSVRDWSKLIGCRFSMLVVTAIGSAGTSGKHGARLRAKKSIEDAIELPVAASHLRDAITHDGRTMSLADWAREKGINRNTLGARLRRARRAGRSITESMEAPVDTRRLRKNVGV